MLNTARSGFLFQETVVDKMGSNSKCLVCKSVLEGDSQSISTDVDLDDEDEIDPSYLIYKNKRRVRLLKNYLSLFCKLININVDDSFGHLFTSTAGNAIVPNEGDLLSPSCCSRCFTLLINIWKLQEIIKQTQDLQQTDVNVLKQLVFKENPSVKYMIQREEITKDSHGSLTSTSTSQDPQTPISSSICVIKPCSVTLKRCDDSFPSTLNKTQNLNLNSYHETSLKTSPNTRLSELKVMESVKNLTAAKTSVEIKTEKIDDNYKPNLVADEDYFDLHDDDDIILENAIIENENDQKEIDEGNKMNSNSDLNGRRRSNNFSFEELQALLQLVKENSDIIYGSRTTKVNKKTRNNIYTKMRDAVNNVSGCGRSTQQIKQKIKNLRNTTNLQRLLTLTPTTSTGNEDLLLQDLSFDCTENEGQDHDDDGPENNLTIKIVNTFPIKSISSVERVNYFNTIQSSEDGSGSGTDLDNQLETSPKRFHRQSKLKAMELVKKLAAVDSSDATKSEINANCKPTLDTDDNEETFDLDDNDETFDPEDVPSDNENIESDQDETDEGNKWNSSTDLFGRRRSSNFSSEEVQVLVQLLKENSHTLCGSKTTIFNKKTKNVIFTKMRDAVNKVGGCDRSTQQIQAKIKNLRNTTNLDKLLNLTPTTATSADNEDFLLQDLSIDCTENMGQDGSNLMKAMTKIKTVNSVQIKPSSSTEGVNYFNKIPSSEGGSGTGVIQTNANECKPGNKNKNAVRFSTKEVQVLSEMINDYVAAVGKKDGTTGDVLKKMTIVVNRVGGRSRSVNQVQMKVKNMQTKMKKRRFKRTTKTVTVPENDNLDAHQGYFNLQSEKSVENENDNVDILSLPKFEVVTPINENLIDLGLGPCKDNPAEHKQNSPPSALNRGGSKPIQNEKRKRFVNFSKEETGLVSKIMEANFKSLFKSDKHTKNKILIKITNRVNQLGGIPRSKEQILMKIRNLQALSKEIKLDPLTADPTALATDTKLQAPSVTNETSNDESLDNGTKDAQTLFIYKNPRALANGNYRFKCSKCERRFKYSRLLQAHAVIHLPKALRPLLNCPKCDDKFLSQRAIDCHLIRIHKEAPVDRPKSKVKYLTCHICDKKFYWYEGTKFRYHVQSHAGDNRPRPFMCDVCGFAFFEKVGLQKHLKTVHSTERYQCEFCAESYKQEPSLRRHLKSCHKELISDQAPKKEAEIPVADFIGPKIAYPCEFCEKVFPLRSRMTKHLLLCKVRCQIQKRNAEK